MQISCCRRQAWSLAACCRTGQLVAATSLAGHHAAVGCLPPRQITARAADAAGAAARIQVRRDWLLVGSDIRLRAGVLSHWLRGRQPTMTAEAFQSRWCHEEVLCSRPAEVTEPPHMHWTTSSLAARSDFPTEGTTHLVLPARPGWPHPVPSPLRYACALHPWEASGRLPGRTECEHAPDQWTPRLPDSQTVTASQHSRSQQLHHLVVLVCIIWASPPGVDSSGSLLFGCLHLATHSSVLSRHFWHDVPGSQAVGSTLYLGRPPLGGCI